MSQSMPQGDRASRLNSVDRPSMAKAKLGISSVDRAAQIVKLAISRSGESQKFVSEDRGRATRLLNGTEKDRLWFHDMIANWPAEVWCELLPLIALEVCGGRFTVKRTLAIEETKEKSA